jgi:hypothetical protein
MPPHEHLDVPEPPDQAGCRRMSISIDLRHQIERGAAA